MSRPAHQPHRAVRLEALCHLAGAPEAFLTPEQKQAFTAVMVEFQAFVNGNAERPESHYALGNIALAQGKWAEAVAAYKTALDLDPLMPAFYANYAEALRENGDDQGAKARLEEGLEKIPDAAILHHAYGLALIRERNYQAAVAHLEKAADHAPENARFAYVYAIALYETGAPGPAVKALKKALVHSPYDPDLLSTTMQYLQATGRAGEAATYHR